jgi:hypothetical protein
MTNFTALQATFIKYDVSTRLQNLNNHLRQIQSLSQDSTNETVESLIRETMYFIEWIAPYVEFDHAFELANLGRFLTRWLFSLEETYNNPTSKSRVNQELTTWAESVSEVA